MTIDRARQAREFLRRTDLEMLGEVVDVSSAALDPLRAVAVIEDYKPLDIQSGTMAMASARRPLRYASWISSAARS